MADENVAFNEFLKTTFGVESPPRGPSPSPPAASAFGPVDFVASGRIASVADAAETSELRAFALAIVQAGTLLCEREDGEKLVARAFAYLSSQFPDVPANGQ